MGGGGSGLGFGGLGADSVAFAIDTFNFNGEPTSPSLQILQSGIANAPVAFVETGLGDGIRDPALQWLATAAYTPSGNNDSAGTLQGTISRPDLGDFTVSAAVDLSGLGSSVFFGFTGSNGAATDGHFITSGVPVPIPAAIWLLGSALTGTGLFRIRRT